MQTPPLPSLCCCLPCRDRLSIVATTEGSQIYQGEGDPNGPVANAYPALWTGGPPLDPASPAEYQNLANPGEAWWWSVNAAAWM